MAPTATMLTAMAASMSKTRPFSAIRSRIGLSQRVPGSAFVIIISA
jgi:hypothetical protein